MNRRRKARRIQAAVLALVLLLLGTQALGAAAYAGLFARRMETPAAYREELSRYPGLTRREVPFSNADGTTLMGWLYAGTQTPVRGLLVAAHGMGFGHLAYLRVIDSFARQGWLVFAYDGTGYDASGGGGTGGPPQAMLDLDAALTAAEALPETEGLPVCLFGHSMGAYAVCTVLPRHPEVRAAAVLAGFDSVSALVRARLGLPGMVLVPGALLWERLRFGEDAGRTALEGFAASEAQLLIVHGTADTEVPISCGLDRFEAALGGDPRFTFLRVEGADHGSLFTPEVREVCLELFAEACE